MADLRRLRSRAHSEGKDVVCPRRLWARSGSDLSVAKSLSPRDSMHLDSKNYREVEVLKSSGYLSGRKQVRCPRRHQALIRPQLERFWIYEKLFRQHPASRIDDASHRCA
jgi:hypothetical protein